MRVVQRPPLDRVYQPDRTDLIAFVASAVVIAIVVAVRCWR